MHSDELFKKEIKCYTSSHIPLIHNSPSNYYTPFTITLTLYLVQHKKHANKLFITHNNNTDKKRGIKSSWFIPVSSDLEEAEQPSNCSNCNRDRFFFGKTGLVVNQSPIQMVLSPSANVQGWPVNCVCVCVCVYVWVFWYYIYCTLTEIFLNLTEVFLTLTGVFPCFFFSCKANARVKLTKMEHSPHSSTLVVICVVRLLFVLFVCKCVLPPGDNPSAVNKYISYHIISNPVPRWIMYGVYLNSLILLQNGAHFSLGTNLT